MTGRDVVITYPASKMVDTGFNICLTQMLLADGKSDPPRIDDVLGYITSPLLADARNVLARAFLATGRDWCLMLDTDMAFPADTLDRLLEVADPEVCPIVSGLYFGGKPEGPAIPHAYVADASESSFAPVRGTTGMGEYDGLGEVNMVGAGCLLVHREAFLAIAETFEQTGFPWFAHAVRDGHTIGEDTVFCMRANAVGLKVHCLFDLDLGHIKSGIVDKRTHKAYLELLEQGWTEQELEEDLGSRFKFSGFADLGGQVLRDRKAATDTRIKGQVESLLGTNGTRKGA